MVVSSFFFNVHITSMTCYSLMYLFSYDFTFIVDTVRHSPLYTNKQQRNSIKEITRSVLPRLMQQLKKNSQKSITFNHSPHWNFWQIMDLISIIMEEAEMLMKLFIGLRRKLELFPSNSQASVRWNNLCKIIRLLLFSWEKRATMILKPTREQQAPLRR